VVIKVCAQSGLTEERFQRGQALKGMSNIKKRISS
jgi:hypothetical protein